MFALQKFCPVLEKHTPIAERSVLGTSWITLEKYENEQDARNALNKPFHDNAQRKLRVVAV